MCDELAGMVVAVEQLRNNCRNCGSSLSGEYCAACGQREGREDLRFTEAVGDVVGDVFTWDSRLWGTLVPLLFRPGFLSAEFNAGRRARYMPPFRLYIVISFVLFFLLSITGGEAMVVNGEDATVVAPITITRDAGEARDRPPPVDAEPAPGVEVEEQDPDLQALQGDEGRRISIRLGGDDAPPWLRRLERRMEANAERVRSDPSDFVEALFEYLPQTMFLMLPIFALLLKILYVLSPYHYLQHFVFALHYHSFVYLLYLLAAFIEALGWDGGGLMVLVLLVYLLLALRRTYHSGWLGAVGKSLALAATYSLVLLLGFSAAALVLLTAM